MIKARILLLLKMTIWSNALWAEPRPASIPFYNSNGRLACLLPTDIGFEEADAEVRFLGYKAVRLPSPYSQRCGEVGLVRRQPVTKSTDSSSRRLRGRSIEEGEQASSRSEGHSEMDMSFLPPSTRSRPTPRSRQPFRSHLQETEAQSGCVNCSAIGGEDHLSALNQMSRETYHQTARPRCEAQGFQAGPFQGALRGNLQTILQDYTERAQGAIRRAYLALVPPEGTQEYEKVRRLTQNFQDFDSVDPIVLKKLLRKSHRDCYKFVKAALSNDYSVLDTYNRRRPDFRTQSRRRANTQLVGQFCGRERGDLAEKHWLNSAVGAGTSGPQLEKRGFINLMDPSWGVSRQFRTEQSAPEGAVLVYRCARNGRLLPNSQCYGDIAIRSRNGYLRDFFTPYSITTRGTRVLVGIYIKPQGDL